MQRRFKVNSYTTYSIGCFLVWAIIFGIGALHPQDTGHVLLLVFGGWFIGWLSATIARYVYPPPKQERTDRPNEHTRAM